LTYQVSTNEIAILYKGTSYVVSLTPPLPLTPTNANSFVIKSIDGSPVSVGADTAAHLYGAAQAYNLLQRLYDVAHVDQTASTWANVIQADTEILGWSAASNALSRVSGLVLGGLFTGGMAAAVAAGSAEAFESLTQDLAPSLAGLAFTTVAVQDATYLLEQAASGYQTIQNNINKSEHTDFV
jgi:hypothetical protein